MAEMDKGYESYRRNLKRRFGLKDIHIAQGHMRASDPSWKGRRPEDVDHIPGMSDVVIVQDNATLTGSIRPEGIDEMMAEWEHQLSARPEGADPRSFTRQVIAEHLALNRHRDGDAGELLLCGAVWLAATHPGEGASVLAFLKRGDVEIRYDILSDDAKRERRFQLVLGDFRNPNSPR